VEVDLADSADQPIIGYCRDLATWVMLGQHKPAGAPTDHARAAVRTAVNVGLKVVYGYGSKSPQSVDLSDITTRRDVL
jgi:hypothetical protein